MKSMILGLAASALALSLVAGGAKAETLQFTVVDGVNTAVFDVSQTPTPSLDTSNLFQLDNVQIDITSNGNKSVVTENVDFYAKNSATEFIADQDSFFADTLGLTTGAYYTGSTSDPTFVVGSYGIAGDSLTITNLAATPLPAALPLFAGGLGLISLLSRGKKRNPQGGLAAI